MRIFSKLLFVFCTVHTILFAEEWKTVYLASFPRSGNHWVRFLVEEATHIATSSVYRDWNFPHLHKIFPWGGYCTDHGYEGNCRFPTIDDPILLKTHYPFLPKKIDPTSKVTICLIRHPIDSFWSFYLFKGGKNDTVINEDTLINNTTLMNLITRWRQFYEYWEKQPGVLFVRYEDLHANTEYYLNAILQTAGFTFSQTDIERAIAKHVPEGMPLKHIHCYTSDCIEIIQSELADILERFNYDLLMIEPQEITH